MKKIISMLSFITALSSSIIVVSCKTNNTNQKINEKNNKTDSKDKEKLDNNKNNNESGKEENKPQDDQAPKSPDISNKDKNERIDNFAEKIKKEIEDIRNRDKIIRLKSYVYYTHLIILEVFFIWIFLKFFHCYIIQ
ncbi:Vmc-like lipoprotein signal peptide domain-containing protein [Mycoplasma mycoides]|uniref:Vmc-like lipoprotein signal peptide domain-containing protein n=1 Tax=Mycoplasma mycoides TaxID=2102 RepID=UPI00223F13D1|nr:hypothetical protein [Mycoplasma mycoides]QVK07221.1 hypothetical protein I7642_02055 [Mycoplasma mycoides subsp. capri]